MDTPVSAPSTCRNADLSESDRSLGWLQFHELEKIVAMAPESSWELDEIEFTQLKSRWAAEPQPQATKKPRNRRE
jgi:hypothetical protein